ncbi:MAG TPA: alpha/beta hydrolase [Candidatus Cottocaccamicrobium excrementipullorum]|nr:alpha/beta hydrolase [Candidatus Cottocaccamicrobium excrementipullorum]
MSYFNHENLLQKDDFGKPQEGKAGKIYYEVRGAGMPVVFLHGNTASSRMFEPLLPLYEDKFQVILMDFLGNGRSERVEKFSPDVWMDQAAQVIGLLEHLKVGKAGLVGCSGGAWTAVNTGLMRPDLIKGIVADSFDGRTLGEGFAENLVRERQAAKKDPQSAGFYAWCQGDDWEQIVDKDTEALLQCAKLGRPLFAAPLSQLSLPLLLMGSLGDQMTRRDLKQEYEEIAGETGGEICLFPQGGHPALFSNAEEAAEVICRFFQK